jgi:dihydrofolate reductase
VSQVTPTPAWFDYSGPQLECCKLEELRRAESMLLGRVTYEGFAEASPPRDGEIADLVDDLRLMVFPVIVGGGRGIFPATFHKSTFALVESETVPPNVVALTYTRAAG